jgi:S1-C subfamily serine protease
MRWRLSIMAIMALVFVGLVTPLWAETQPEPKRPWLGFGYRIYEFGPKSPVRQWLYVLRVEPNGPAFKAGLRVQDAIVEIDRKAVNFASSAAAIQFFRSIRIGEQLELKVMRGQKVGVVRIRAVELPSMYAPAWTNNEALAQREDASKTKTRDE